MTNSEPLLFAGIDPAFSKPSVIAVIREEGTKLKMAELSELTKREELLRILEDKGLKSFTVDCPLYLPPEGETQRDEERKLGEFAKKNEMVISSQPPRGGLESMPALHEWVRELLELEQPPTPGGFVKGLGGKCDVYEVYPHASFTILARAKNYPTLANNKTEEGQAQLLKLLEKFVPDLKIDIRQGLIPDALDAVVSALTHYFIMTGRAQKLGKCLWIPDISKI